MQPVARSGILNAARLKRDRWQDTWLCDEATIPAALEDAVDGAPRNRRRPSGMGVFGGLMLLFGVVAATHPHYWERQTFVVGTVTAISIGCLAVLTWMSFGLLGYQVTPDAIDAPNWLVYLFLGGIGILALVLFSWLFVSGRLLGPPAV